MQERRILESWKEISDYLKRSIKTCRRWEDTLGLPIHRLDGTPRARVFAYPEELDRWVAEKLNHIEAEAQETIVLRGRKIKLLLIASASIVALAAVVIVARQFSFQPAVPFPSHNPFLAVLPFENVSAEESLEDWRTALQYLIITDLRQSRLVNMIRMGEIHDSLVELKLLEAKKYSPEDIKKVAERVEADYATTGSLLKSGEDFIINVFIQDPKTGEVIKSIRANCRGEQELFASVDELDKKIKLALRLDRRLVARDIDRDVRTITTSSPQALKIYDRALRLYGTEKGQQAIPLLQDAVKLDPGFSLAYQYLGDFVGFGLRREESLSYRRKALELSGRMSERDRLLLEIRHYQSAPDKDLESTLKALERLGALYPDSYDYFPLASIYVQFEEWDKAIAVLEKFSPRYQKWPNTVLWLVLCYKGKGQFERAEEIMADFQKSKPGEKYFMQERFDLALDQGKYDEALAYIPLIYDRPSKPSEYYDRLGYVYWAKGDWSNAENAYRTVVDQGDQTEEFFRLLNLTILSLSRGRVEEATNLIERGIGIAKGVPMEGLEREAQFAKARLDRLSGRLPEALKEAEQACQDYKTRGLRALPELHLRAQITLEMGQEEEFEKRAEEIRSLIEEEKNPKMMRAYYHLLGLREMKKGRLSEAIGYLGKAVDLLSPGSHKAADGENAQYFYSLAEAYRLQWGGDWNALEMFEKVTLPTTTRSYCGDIYARSFYKMGKIQESFWRSGDPSGDKNKAIENYQKFLSLWGGADSIFTADVEDAKKRLAALESQ